MGDDCRVETLTIELDDEVARRAKSALREHKSLMKKAVIVVGGHHVGKSDTIGNHLKPMLKRPDGQPMTYYDRKFMLNLKRGYIQIQTFKEALKSFLEHSKRYFAYDLLVLAERPETEDGSQLNTIRDALQRASFTVNIVVIEHESEDRAEKAKKIFDILNSN